MAGGPIFSCSPESDFFAAIVIWRVLPETLKHRAPEPISLSGIFRSYRVLAAHRGFRAHLGIGRVSLCRIVCLDFRLAREHAVAAKNAGQPEIGSGARCFNVSGSTRQITMAAKNPIPVSRKKLVRQP